MKTAPPRLKAQTSRRLRPPQKTADPVLHTPEYRAWREAVIRRAHGRCETCGRVEPRMFADHIHERRNGGALFELGNGQCLCGSCHTRKTLAERAARLRS